MQQMITDFNYRETNFVELFFYFISSNRFDKYFKFFNKDTKWCWGIDLALSNYGLKLGILDCFPVKHYFKAVSYNSSLPSPIAELNRIKSSLKTINNKFILRKEKY